MSQLIAQYEASGLRDESQETKDHEQTTTFQRKFLEKVQRLTNTIEDMGNPFQEETGDRISLDTKDVAAPCSANRIAAHLSTGNASFEAHLETLKHDDTSSFYAPIKKINMGFFQQEKHSSLAKDKVLKEDCQLFSKLFISCQNRECDLHEFFFEMRIRHFPHLLASEGSCMCVKSHS